MKKILIGMLAGAAAVCASVIPVSAGYGDSTVWEGIDAGLCSDDGGKLFEQIVLIAGATGALDTDGNGKPNYTVFAPVESVLAGVLDDLNLEISDISANPAIAKTIVNDHVARGSFDQNELEDTDLTRITMLSGYVATVFGSSDPVSRSVPGDVYVAGALIVSGADLANGWLYCINGFIDVTPQVPTNGVDVGGAPAAANAVAKDGLPDTL
jgi:hypothetical protein